MTSPKAAIMTKNPYIPKSPPVFRNAQLAVDQKYVLSPPPLVTYTFVAACCYISLSQVLGAGMNHTKTCRESACRKPRISVARLWCGMAAQDWYKTGIFESRPNGYLQKGGPLSIPKYYNQYSKDPNQASNLWKF